MSYFIQWDHAWHENGFWIHRQILETLVDFVDVVDRMDKEIELFKPPPSPRPPLKFQHSDLKIKGPYSNGKNVPDGV